MFDRRSDRQTFYMRNHARHERRATTASRCKSKSKKARLTLSKMERERERKRKKERERERKGGRREAAGVCIARAS